MEKHLLLKREILGRGIGIRTVVIMTMETPTPIKNNSVVFQSKAITIMLIDFQKFCQDPR